MRSCKWTMPTTLRPPSSTGRAMMPCCSMSRTAVPASSSGVVVLGVRVMTSRIGRSRKASVFSMTRVRSPAVTTPTRLPAWSTTATVPRFSASSTTHSRMGRSGPRAGISPASITSATRSRRLRPSAPPGCSAAKSSRRNPLTSSSVTARASPSAKAAVVLVVGASVSGHASSATLASSTTSAWRARTESGSPVIATSRTPSRLSWLTRPNSSSEAPLLDRRIATSCRPTIPRSPWRESTGWRNDAGVPVDVKVAAILRAMRPDLPTPETITRPPPSVRRRTAALNAGPSRWATRPIASASRASTRRPRSTRSPGSVRDIATLQKVRREETLPVAARLEDLLGDLADGALAAGDVRDDPRRRLDLRHRVRDRHRQPHAREHGEVRKVVADEGTLVPGEPAASQQCLERRELTGRRILAELVHRQLARPQRRGRRFPPRQPDHDEAGGAEHAEAESVLDVKALEFDGVIADDPEVDAVIGEHAVDVEADELQAAGNGLIKHGRRLGRGAPLWPGPRPPPHRSPGTSPSWCPPSSWCTRHRSPRAGCLRAGPAGPC